MDDLISRSTLIEELEKQCPDWKKTSMGFLIKGAIDDCIQIVKRQPTAYNVDKVVKQIEEVTQDLNVIEVMCHLDDSTIQTDLDNFLKANKNEIIRRVKAGGVND